MCAVACGIGMNDDDDLTTTTMLLSSPIIYHLLLDSVSSSLSCLSLLHPLALSSAWWMVGHGFTFTVSRVGLAMVRAVCGGGRAGGGGWRDVRRHRSWSSSSSSSFIVWVCVFDFCGWKREKAESMLQNFRSPMNKKEFEFVFF